MNSEAWIGSRPGEVLVLLLGLWPLWLILGAVVGLPLFQRLYEARRLSRSGIREIDRMDGKRFEEYLEFLFRKLDYRVQRTPYLGDYGADLVIEKEGLRTVIQAKRSRHRVGIKAVQEAAAAQGYYGCTAAMVVTNSAFTPAAVRLARANGVLLGDREWLIGAMLSVSSAPAGGQWRGQ
jgi:restriction system protein